MKWLSPVSSRSRWVGWMLGIGVALIVYTLAGCLLLPAIIKTRLAQRLPALTGRAVTVQRVMFNPFTLTLTIRGLSLTEPDGAAFGSFDELSGNLQLVSIFRRAWVFKELRVNQPVGNIHYQPDAPRSFTELVSAGPAGPQPWPHFVVERLRVEAGTLSIDAADRKRLLTLRQIDLNLSGFDNRTDAPIPATMSFACNGTGTVALRGTVRSSSRSADVHLQVSDLDLRVLQPVVAEIWKLEITGGLLTANGRLRYAAAGPAGPLAQFTGKLDIARFRSVDTRAREELLQLDSLVLTGLDLRYLPHGLDLATVTVVGLRTSALIHADKTSNWKGLVANAEKLHELVVALQLNKRFPFQLGTVSFENASVGFADRSIEPPVMAGLEEIAGHVTGLSSASDATVRVALHGKVDGRSTLAVAGTINPLADSLKLDLTFSLQNGELTPGSPYAAKYIGYPIRQGQLSIEAHYTVNHGMLQAENKLTLQQLRLGAKNNSPDATPLQVKLAIALLQDREGVFTFDVPVNGNLNDPQFQLGPVIHDVFLSMITKAVSNPFGLLASLFGRGEQLSFVNFEPGRAVFVAGETRKLDTLAKALAARSALELTITGSADATSDRLALATAKLDRQLKLRQLAEQANLGDPDVATAGLSLAPRDYQRLLRLAYVEVVGTNPVVVVEPPTLSGPTQNFGPRPPSHGVATLAIWHPLDGTTSFLDLTFADKEAGLLATIDVTSADFHALMQARAEQVQHYLIHSGRVAPDRLFIVAPPALDPSSPGQCRVDLSLQ